MTWPVTIQTLEALGQQAVADSAGALAGFSIAFDEASLTHHPGY